MTCLLAAATPLEIAPFLAHYSRHPGFVSGRLDIDVLLTGIGLTATTYHLQKQLSLKKPDLIIQAGIAGCFDKDLTLGEVMVVQQDTIADQGVLEGRELRTLFDMGFLKPNQFPYKNGWLVNPHKDLLKKSGLKKIKGISVNQVTATGRMSRLYKEHFQPGVESMEGAALHYTCLMENIPFLQLRGLSNYAGERNKEKWKMKESIINLNNELMRVLQSL